MFSFQTSQQTSSPIDLETFCWVPLNMLCPQWYCPSLPTSALPRLMLRVRESVYRHCHCGHLTSSKTTESPCMKYLSSFDSFMWISSILDSVGSIPQLIGYFIHNIGRNLDFFKRTFSLNSRSIRNKYWKDLWFSYSVYLQYKYFPWRINFYFLNSCLLFPI